MFKPTSPRVLLFSSIYLLHTGSTDRYNARVAWRLLPSLALRVASAHSAAAARRPARHRRRRHGSSASTAHAGPWPATGRPRPGSGSTARSTGPPAPAPSRVYLRREVYMRLMPFKCSGQINQIMVKCASCRSALHARTHARTHTRTLARTHTNTHSSTLRGLGMKAK
jgi:hypothetical protein